MRVPRLHEQGFQHVAVEGEGEAGILPQLLEGLVACRLARPQQQVVVAADVAGPLQGEDSVFPGPVSWQPPAVLSWQRERQRRTTTKPANHACGSRRPGEPGSGTSPGRRPRRPADWTTPAGRRAGPWGRAAAPARRRPLRRAGRRTVPPVPGRRSRRFSGQPRKSGAAAGGNRPGWSSWSRLHAHSPNLVE